MMIFITYWLSFLVEFKDGDGDVGSMHIREASSTNQLKDLGGTALNQTIRSSQLMPPSVFIIAIIMKVS